MKLKELQTTPSSKEQFIEECYAFTKKWADEFKYLLKNGAVNEGDWDNYFQNKLRDHYSD